MSNDWLDAKSGAEKGFSLGSFDRDYIARFPVAVVEHAGRIVAFANLWTGDGRRELSIDLMRYHRSAPRSVMEALLVHVLAWGKAQGYRVVRARHGADVRLRILADRPAVGPRGALPLHARRRDLPASRACAPTKRSSTPYGSPTTSPTAAASKLPRILADVAVLVAGGYRRIFRK